MLSARLSYFPPTPSFGRLLVLFVDTILSVPFGGHISFPRMFDMNPYASKVDSCARWVVRNMPKVRRLDAVRNVNGIKPACVCVCVVFGIFHMHEMKCLFGQTANAPKFTRNLNSVYCVTICNRNVWTKNLPWFQHHFRFTFAHLHSHSNAHVHGLFRAFFGPSFIRHLTRPLHPTFCRFAFFFNIHLYLSPLTLLRIRPSLVSVFASLPLYIVTLSQTMTRLSANDDNLHDIQLI